MEQLALPDPHDERPVMNAELFKACAAKLKCMQQAREMLDRAQNAGNPYIYHNVRPIHRLLADTARQDEDPFTTEITPLKRWPCPKCGEEAGAPDYGYAIDFGGFAYWCESCGYWWKE